MTRLHDDPTATGIVELPEDWLVLSARLTGALPALTDREDVVVNCAPGAGRGSPACYLPHIGLIEIDATHLDGLSPTGLDPMRPADRDRYPVVWGLLAHETSHADHTRWRPPAGTPAPVTEAALILEEARIEAAHLARRPASRRWIRTAITQLILADFTLRTPEPAPDPEAAPDPEPTPDPEAAPGAEAAPTAPSDPPGPSDPSATASGAPAAGPALAWGMTAADAARAATLLLARVDAGVLDADETAKVHTVVADILGEEKFTDLQTVWREALGTGDEDADAMVALGRRWCDIAGINPDPPPGEATDTGQPGDGAGPEGAPSPLARAVSEALGAVREADRRNDEPPDRPPAGDRAAEEKTRADAKRHANKASKVSDDHRFADGFTNLAGRRAPTAREQTAARQLARALRTAARREPTTRTVTSATPPGRLRMRAALAADAQRAAGAVPTAEPFTRTLRRTTPSPPLRVGIAADVSLSMRMAAGPVASAAWILARATGHLPDAHSATVIFGQHVRPLARAGRAPTHVTEFQTDDFTEDFVGAVDTLDTTLGLSRRDGARLLVVISDGVYAGDYQQTVGRARLDRLAAAGCALLWLTNIDHLTPWMSGLSAYRLTDPAATADAIGHAAVTALRTA